MIILVILLSFCTVNLSATKVEEFLDNQMQNALQDISLEETKNNSKQIKDVNITSTTSVNGERLYTTWSKWSPCRKCFKVRRKRCIHKQCKHSILYERRPCSTARCKRKNRRKPEMNIVQRVDLKRLDVTDDRLYGRWSEWTPCSAQCMTRRHRQCRVAGNCRPPVDVQLAYCFRAHTACQQWIQDMLHQQYPNRRYAYDIDTPTTNRRKPKKRNPRKCGIPYKSPPHQYRRLLKIMGGHITKTNRWPWHVAILNWNKEVFCGGTLISPNWVLTAAHCLRRVLYVRLNDFDISTWDGSEIEYLITKMYKHPKYDWLTVDNDIALLRLPKSVPIPYACLPTTKPLPEKQNCTIVGWGKRTPNDFRGSKYLREAQLPIVPKSTCKYSYRNYIITDNMFCAGYKDGGVDTCSGDSGGGFMCPRKGRRIGWTVQGITSFGESCGKRTKYGIYTDVRNYLPWMRRIMKKT